MIWSNLLEWLDFGIYGYSQGEISRAFFGNEMDNHDNNNNNLYGWWAFGLGYSMRPIGAYVLGKLADQDESTSSTTSSWRRYSLRIAVGGMGLATAGLALWPSHCRVHTEDEDESSYYDDPQYCLSSIYATAIPALVWRCIQGFSAGAAAGGVNVMQSELVVGVTSRSRSGTSHATADDSRTTIIHCQAVGVNNVSGTAASIVAASVVYGLRSLLGTTTYATWGWRIALLGVLPPSLLATGLLSSSSSHPPKAPPEEQVAPEDTYPTRGHYELSPAQDWIVNDDDDDVVDTLNDKAFDQYLDEPTQDMPLTRSSLPQDDKDMITSNTTTATATEILTSSSMVPQWWLWTLSIGVQCAISSTNNLNIYLVQYSMDHLGLSPEQATALAMVGKVVQLLLTPLCAALGDRYGWYTVCAWSGGACTVVAMFIFHLSTTSLSIVVLWLAGILPLCATPWIVLAPLLVTSLFDRDTRSQGTSLIMALGTALSGFLPLLLELTASKGLVLTSLTGLATCTIVWIQHQVCQGRIVVYQGTRAHMRTFIR